MSLRNILNRKVVSCRPDSSVREVAELMDEENIGSVLVVEGEKPVGIITDRDIVVRCIVKGLDCSGTQAKDLMSGKLETVSADCGLYDVLQTMRKREIRRVPVVESDGKAIGLLSFGDVYQLLAKEISDLSGPMAPEEPKIEEQAA